jgi:hypothetical protein
MVATPWVLGVEKVVLRRSVTYGTLLVDLERQQPGAILGAYNRAFAEVALIHS